MEFWQSTTPFPPQFWPPPPSQSLSSYGYFTDQQQPTTRGRISPWFGIGCNVKWFEQGMGRAHGNVDMSYNVNPDILRALEKEKIREEIIAAEMARRRELEAEVREELRIEREMALRMKGGYASDRFCAPMESWGKCLMPEAGGKLAMSLEERLRIQGRTETSGMDMLPFQRQKEKIIFLAKRSGNKQRSRRAHALKPEKSTAGFIGLGVHQELKAKPSANVCGRKRKFESAEKVNIPELSSVENKRGKKAWRCDLCQVCPTSEVSLNDHLRGKKHMAMEDAMSRKKLKGENTGTGILPKITGVPISEVVTPKREKKAWRCDLCQVCPTSKVSLNDHLRGKKHMAMEDAMSRKKVKGENPGTGIVPKITEVPISEEVTPKKPKVIERVRKFVEAQKMYKDKFSFWCEVCQIGANSEKAMEAHRKGKKHSWMLNL